MPTPVNRVLDGLLALQEDRARRRAVKAFTEDGKGPVKPPGAPSTLA